MKKGNGHATRKKKIVATTIPELKRSFDALEAEVATILHSVSSPAQRVKRFQTAWRKIFGRPVDAAAAQAYLQVKSRRIGKKTRKAQKGGAGAPLDHQTGPGIYGPHGVFPPYVASGLSFYNTVNQIGQFKGCGTENITPKIPADMGSNQFGGGVLTDALHAVTTRPIPSSAPPPSFLRDLQTMWQGGQVGPSPAAEENPLKYV
jgi:hypothetical protein